MENNIGKRRLKILIVLSFLAISVIGIKLYNMDIDKKKVLEIEKEIKENREFLKALEETNVAEVEKKLDEKYKKDEGKSEDKKPNKPDTPKNTTTKSNRLYFEDSVFMGDSLTEPLDFYDILNKSSVLAKKGQSVLDAKIAANKLSGLNPKRVFLLYGLNDLDMFPNIADFKKNYGELVDAVKQNAANAEVYAQSVMPVQKRVQDKSKSYSDERIAKFTEAVQQVAKEKDIHYIDIKPVIKDKEYLFEPDGMHFTAKFYDFWLDYLKDYLENPKNR